MLIYLLESFSNCLYIQLSVFLKVIIIDNAQGGDSSERRAPSVTNDALLTHRDRSRAHGKRTLGELLKGDKERSNIFYVEIIDKEEFLLKKTTYKK